MPELNSLSDAARAVRQQDRDRFVTALFAPADRRQALFVLYAFNLEIARARELVREPMLGRIRLQWWRDCLTALYAGQDGGQPLARELGAVIAHHGLAETEFTLLLDSRASDMDDQPPADLAAMETYAEGTAAPLARLALAVLDAKGETELEVARHVGIAWALTGLLRAVPYHAAAKRLYLPLDLLEIHGVSQQQIFSGKGSPGLIQVGQEISTLARSHLRQARLHSGQVARQALSPLLTAPLAESYLDALDKSGGDLLSTDWSRVRPRPMRLAWCAFRGRI